MKQKFIISVQFEDVGKNYFFDATHFPDLKPDDPVVVRTSRGLQLAKVVQINLDQADLDMNSFKSVERPATPQDLLLRKDLALREQEIIEKIRKHLVDIGLAAIKVVSAEYSLDGNRLFILINSDTSVNFNVKHFHQDIQKIIGDAKLEVRQVGPRDAAKLIRGMGACGLETRCCSKFLTEFASISIRMAKTQDISLTPSEITGMCGRLRCCLIYEYDLYVESIKTLPKRKRKVVTPYGEGRVIQILPLQQAVIVDLPNIGPKSFTKEELDHAKKVADGETVEPLPEVEDSSLSDEVVSRAEDQVVERNHDLSKDQNKTSQNQNRRGRNSRRSNRRNR